LICLLNSNDMPAKNRCEWTPEFLPRILATSNFMVLMAILYLGVYILSEKTNHPGRSKFWRRCKIQLVSPNVNMLRPWLSKPFLLPKLPNFSTTMFLPRPDLLMLVTPPNLRRRAPHLSRSWQITRCVSICLHD